MALSVESGVTQDDDLDRFLPPVAQLDMPYQVLERRPAAERALPALLRQLVARRARHE